MKRSKSNPIKLKLVRNMAGLISGRIISEEKEQFCEVMTGHGKTDKTMVSSVPLVQGMVFRDKYGDHSISKVLESRSSKFADKRLAYWAKIETK